MDKTESRIPEIGVQIPAWSQKLMVAAMVDHIRVIVNREALDDM